MRQGETAMSPGHHRLQGRLGRLRRNEALVVRVRRPTSDHRRRADSRHGVGFRPDIEGIRAVAILLVIAYHANVGQLPGGFVGVDVFFVVSGFLITGLIVREINTTGRVDLVAFYARRARRLLPAALLVIAATMIASKVALPPLRLDAVAADGAAAALYVSNLRFAAQATDYLQADLAPSPLLHYWSLAVEEQFYLFWPALLAIVTMVTRHRAAVAIAVALVGLASFGTSLWLTAVNAPLAFFLLPTRAWELAVGGLIAVGVARIRPSPMVAGVLGIVGIASVVASGVLLTADMPFPGLAATLPVAGSALLLLAGLGTSRSAVSLMLATRPMRWVGRISYSLYLWHWPMLVIPAAAVGRELGGPAVVGLVALTFVLAALSQRYVEDPIRSSRVLPFPPRTSLTMAVTASVAVALLSLSLLGAPVANGVASGQATPPPLSLHTSTPASGGGGTAGAPTMPESSSGPTTAGGPVPDPLRAQLERERSMIPPIFRDGCHLEAADTELGDCVYGVPSSPETVFLIGDSHAAQWFPAMERLANTNQWRLVSLTKGACPVAAVAVWSPTLKRASTECDQWRANVIDRIKTEHPAMVVVSNSRLQVLLVDGKQATSLESERTWIDALRATLLDLKDGASEVVLIGDTPNPAVDPPVCLSAHLDDTLACATDRLESTNPVRSQDEQQLAESIGVSWIDPTDLVCPSDPCPVVIDGYLVYRDGGHMAVSFAAALAPYIGRLLPPIQGN